MVSIGGKGESNVSRVKNRGTRATKDDGRHTRNPGIDKKTPTDLDSLVPADID